VAGYFWTVTCHEKCSRKGNGQKMKWGQKKIVSFVTRTRKVQDWEKKGLVRKTNKKKQKKHGDGDRKRVGGQSFPTLEWDKNFFQARAKTQV